MTARAAPLVELAMPWEKNPGERVWTAMTAAGGSLIVSAVEGGFEAIADPPQGLWELSKVTSDPLPSRQRAQEWAEQKAAANEW